MEKDFTEQLLVSQHDAQKTMHDLTNKFATAEKEIVAFTQQLTEHEMKVRHRTFSNYLTCTIPTLIWHMSETNFNATA